MRNMKAMLIACTHTSSIVWEGKDTRDLWSLGKQSRYSDLTGKATERLQKGLTFIFIFIFREAFRERLYMGGLIGNVRSSTIPFFYLGLGPASCFMCANLIDFLGALCRCRVLCKAVYRIRALVACICYCFSAKVNFHPTGSPASVFLLFIICALCHWS